jgi:hypothetical protein
LNGVLQLNTPEDFISSPQLGNIWVKEQFINGTDIYNIFNNPITISGINKHILNTPYFHNQLYNDFVKTQSQEKYVGSSYLLLNSLPFKDLDDKFQSNDKYNIYNLNQGSEVLVSSVFREIGASHYIPYHMMLKWGSIYHRYKKYINENIDIIANVTTPIDGSIFYDAREYRISSVL